MSAFTCGSFFFFFTVGGCDGGGGGVGAFYYCTLSKEVKPDHTDELPHRKRTDLGPEADRSAPVPHSGITNPVSPQTTAVRELVFLRFTNLPPLLCFPFL